MKQRDGTMYCVYIMSSRSKVLCVGVTDDLERRVGEHKQGLSSGFTARYRVKRLVYYEESSDIQAAISREKQIKGWLRRKKIELIESANPEWRDLSESWPGEGDPTERRGVQEP